MKEDTRKFAVYSRKSKYTGKGESIGNQIELCKNYLKTKYNAEDENILVYEDEGYTGANTNRPEFKKMLKDIKSKKIRTVICYRLDRISRNVLDFCNLKDELADYNVDFISIREDFDTSTPMGSAMLLITSVFAQLERDTIAERIRDNMRELAKTGRWLGGTTPLGFKSEEIEKLTVDGKKRKLFKLSPIPEEQQTYKIITSKFVELKSLTKLYAYTLQSEMKTRKNAYFSTFSLRSILTNPVYAMADSDTLQYFKERNADIFGEEKFDGKHGLMVYNKTNQKAGKRQRVREVEDWIVSVGKHKGFLTGKQWVEIQNLIELNSEKRFRKPSINTSLLSGIIYCGDCGSHMRPRLNHAVSADGERSFSYSCELKEHSRSAKCKSRNIMGVELDKKVFEIIQTFTNPNGKFYSELKRMAKGEFEVDEKDTSETEALQKTKSQNTKTISGLVQKLALVDDEFTESITDEIRKLKEANKRIDEQLTILTDKKNKTEKEINSAKMVLNILNTYFQKFNSLDTVTKRSLIRLIVKSVEIKDNDVIINFIGSNSDNSKENILCLFDGDSKSNNYGDRV